MNQPLDIVILGLSITSSWGNGHATTYRSLVRGLASRGHRVLFLEKNTEWYAGNRDEPQPAGARTELYEDFDDLVARFEGAVAGADLVIVGSFVPDGVRVGSWVTSVATGITAFYDIDTPVTLAQLAQGQRDFIAPELIPRYHLYLSFTGGPALRFVESNYGSRMARALYCSVDPWQYRPVPRVHRWDLGYLGTYSSDRQPALDELLLETARQWTKGRFSVVGPKYPDDVRWPANVDRNTHLSPAEHPAFYCSQRFTLNITREAMRFMGYSPSVRLFEAGATGTPIISDWWEGLDALFEIDREILIAASAEDMLRKLHEYPESQRRTLGEAARRRILTEHTPQQRAAQLEGYLQEVHDNLSSNPPRRNGRQRKSAGGMDSGLASQSAGEAAGGESGGETGAIPSARRLFKPAGAGR